MDKIKIGERTFFLGMITPKTLNVLREKVKDLAIGDPDSDDKTDIGDAVLFVLTAIFDGDEEKAFEIGQELARTEIENVTVEQITEAVKLIRERIDLSSN